MNAVREHLGDPEVVLVGHSLGTQVCLEAYRARPERVRGLVLLCGSFGRVTHTFKGTDVLSAVLPSVLDWSAKHPRLLRALWSRVPVRVAIKLAVLSGDIDPHKVRVEDVEPYFKHALHVDFTLFARMLQAAGRTLGAGLTARDSRAYPGRCGVARYLHAARGFRGHGRRHTRAQDSPSFPAARTFCRSKSGIRSATCSAIF